LITFFVGFLLKEIFCRLEPKDQLSVANVNKEWSQVMVEQTWFRQSVGCTGEAVVEVKDFNKETLHLKELICLPEDKPKPAFINEQFIEDLKSGFPKSETLLWF
jgi:hypothetical protein